METEFSDSEDIIVIDHSKNNDGNPSKKISERLFQARDLKSVSSVDSRGGSQKDGQRTAIKKESSRNPPNKTIATQTDSWINISKQTFYIVSAAVLVLIILNGIIFCRVIFFNYGPQPIENDSISLENIIKRFQKETDVIIKGIRYRTLKYQHEMKELFKKSSAFEVKIITIDKFKTEIEQAITDVKKDVQEKMSNLLNYQAKLDNKISILAEEKNRITSLIQDQNTIIEAVKTFYQKDVALIHEKSAEMDSNLKVYIETVEELKHSVPDNDELTSKLMKMKELSEKIDLNEQEIIKLNERVETAEKSHLKLRNAVQENEVYVKRFSESTSYTDEHQIFLEKVEALEEMINKIYPNTFNKSAVMAVFGLIFLLIFGIYTFQLKDHYNRGEFPGITKHDSDAVMRCIPNRPELQKAVCVISFDRDKQNGHKALFDSLELGVTAEYHVINGHQEITKLPRCQVYLMCAEFSERHVIIEQPNLGLGDLKRTTYNAIMKMGGCLVIIYCKDPGSRQLAADRRYNRNIHSVTSQYELIDLDKKGQFFSIYNVPTQYQMQELKNVILKNLHRQDVT